MSRANRQLAAAASAYDNQSPPDDPDYGLDDADGDIAAELVEADEVGLLVMEVRESEALLNWLASNALIPDRYLSAFRDLDRRASGLSRRADELCEAHS